MAENNNEVAKVAINDIGTEEDFIKAVDSTIKNFDVSFAIVLSGVS